jgi:brefeldin A-resistance guanine nucleotide exchange factor 1
MPLITSLLKRVRAATLLSKVFLHYLVLLSEVEADKEFLDLWLKIITIMDRLVNSGQGDMEEAVGENLKNMLLVLSNGGYLVPPDQEPEKEQLWNETWKRINRFQPDLFKELFPEEVAKPKRSKDERRSRDERPKEECEAKGETKEMVVGEEKKEAEAEAEAEAEI